MATAADLRTWRRSLCAVAAGMLLVACDLSPLSGADGPGGGTPVETVTALEVEVDDVGTEPAIQARHDATSPSER